MQITGINLNIQIQISLLYELQLLKVDFYIPRSVITLIMKEIKSKYPAHVISTHVLFAFNFHFPLVILITMECPCVIEWFVWLPIQVIALGLKWWWSFGSYSDYVFAIFCSLTFYFLTFHFSFTWRLLKKKKKKIRPLFPFLYKLWQLRKVL